MAAPRGRVCEGVDGDIGEAEQCSTEYHERIKRDPLRWARETEPPRGHAAQPLLEHRGGWLRVGNCRSCHSTLYAPVRARLKVVK